MQPPRTARSVEKMAPHRHRLIKGLANWKSNSRAPSSPGNHSRRFRACLERGKYSLFLCFFCEIELISVKFLCDSCEIHTFQTGPNRNLVEKWTSHSHGLQGFRRVIYELIYLPQITICFGRYSLGQT